jgi:hypothetical protein
MAATNRPGVEITQALAQTATVQAAPALTPVVIGIVRQIVELRQDDGSINPSAKYSAQKYNQAAFNVPQASFPDPRGIIDEVNVDESKIAAALYFGGRLTSLPRGSHGSTGSSFLRDIDTFAKPVIRSTVADSFIFASGAGSVLTLAFDRVNPADVSADVTVTLVGTLTTAEVVEEINTAVGATVAVEFVDTLGDFGPALASYVQIASTSAGAASSITLRPGTSALKILFGAAFDDSKEYRIVGAGFRGQDDADGDLTTPWIEFFRGEYYVDDVITVFPADNLANSVWVGLLSTTAETFASAKAAAVTFSGASPTVPLKAATGTKAGDSFWASGARVGGTAEVTKLEATRFKVGNLNSVLSVFDADGVPTTRVYDAFEVNTLSHPTPFAPKFTYFVANNLVFGEVLPAGTEATLTGSNTGFLARSAYVQSTAAITFPVNLASLTIDYQITTDGVQGDQSTYIFTGGPFANIGALVAALTGEIPGITVTNSLNRLVLRTTATGADQAISIKSTGTANTALLFSIVVATEDTGKDVEFATAATLTGDAFSLPLAFLTGMNVSVTVVDAKGTHTLSGTLGAGAGAATTISALATAVESVVGDDGGIPTLMFSGPADAYGALTVTSLEGGTDVSISITATDEGDAFRFMGFYDNAGDEPAKVASTATAYPLALNTLVLSVAIDEGAGPTTLTDTLGAGEAAAVSGAALAALLNARVPLTEITGRRVVQYIGDLGGTDSLRIRTVLGGATKSLDVDAGVGTAGVLVGFITVTNDTDTGAASVGNADDVGADGLKSTTLGFFLDNSPEVIEAQFSTNSLQDAIDEINRVVGGATDIASETASALTLTSALKGVASEVEIATDVAYTADTVLGITGSSRGTGRPNPDFYVDSLGGVVLGAHILRNGSTGIPFGLTSALADLYISYRGIRQDVTALAAQPSTLTFNTVAEMEEAIGPITTENPGALACFLAMSNAPTTQVTFLGVDEISDAAPYGTIDAWARALEILESKQAYCLAPITDDPYIEGLVSAHVQALSTPAARDERICFIWTEVPSRAVAITAASSTGGSTNGINNSFTMDVNPSSELIANGIDPGDPIPYADQLYLEVVIVESNVSTLRRYSVSDVNGVVLTLRTTFLATENTDSFYTTTTLDGLLGLSSQTWSLKIRGAELLVQGTTRKDLTAITEAAADEGQAYASRRVYYLFHGDIETSVNGLVLRVPGFYMTACKAGMVAQLAAQQPFTQVPIQGVSKVYGVDDTFTEDQMDTVADGGRYLVINFGGQVVSRHSRSTDTSSIEARELSITKQIDKLAKSLRNTNRNFIGRYVITPNFLDMLTMANQGALEKEVLLGTVNGAKLVSILQDESNPDTILEEVEVQPAYPCNKIRITIVS